MVLLPTAQLFLKAVRRETKVKDPNEANLINGILKVTKDEQKMIRFLRRSRGKAYR